MPRSYRWRLFDEKRQMLPAIEREAQLSDCACAAKRLQQDLYVLGLFLAR